MSRRWHLAQLNIGSLIAAQGDPRVQAFFDALDDINALAEASPGFVWRLKGEDSGNATGLTPTADPLLIPNLSVWEDVNSLFAYVYKSAHIDIMSQRRSFFAPPPKGSAYLVLWWLPADTLPTLNDALAKLWHLDRFGPTSLAFTFKQRYEMPDSDIAQHQGLEGL